MRIGKAKAKPGEEIETAGRNEYRPYATKIVAMLDRELTALQALLNEFIEEKRHANSNS